MTTFTNSRIGSNFVNLRDRKGQSTNPESSSAISSSQGLKLVLPEENTYEPTNAFSNSRTQMRMLKGKVERGAESIDRQKIGGGINGEAVGGAKGNAFTMAPLSSTQMAHTFKPKQEDKADTLTDFKHLASRPPLPPSGLKLVLPDEAPVANEKEKRSTGLGFGATSEATKEPQGRRILIADEKKGDSRDKKIMIQPTADKKEEAVLSAQQQQPQQQPQQQRQPEPTKNVVVPTAGQPPKASEPEQELIENQNELIVCPEGCGRKFNRKALETHVKACKIVFMSKRKEFNAQAKRVADKEQAKLIKEAKGKERKEKPGTKLEKTGEAWKTQSEGFRAVVKALKQEEVQVGDEEIGAVKCEYCEKIFNEVLYQKHLLICEVKKEREKKLTKKTSKRG